MAAPKRLDLNEMAHRAGHEVDVRVKSAETAEELASRLRREEADARVARIKDLVFSGAFPILVVVVAGFCLWTATRDGSSVDDKKWALALLTLIVSGGVGYLTGKAQGSK